METKFEAKLQIQPLHIINMSFIRSAFEFRFKDKSNGLEKQPSLKDIYPAELNIGSGVTFYDEGTEHCLEVLVSVKTQDESKLCSFHVDCVGKYLWKGEVFDEKIKKKIFAWAVSVQISAIREHVARETSNGPFKSPYYLPIALVGVAEKEEEK